MDDATHEPVDLYCEDSGQGTPLVFLTGLGGDSRAFSATAPSFAKRWRTLVFDHRDSGKSPQLAHEYSLADMVGDVVRALDARGLERVSIVGHSLGGFMAQELAIRHPERLRALVLVSSYPGGDPWRRALVDSWILIRSRVSAGEFMRVTLPWLVSPVFYERSVAQIEGLIRFVERDERAQDADAYARQARASFGHDTRARLRDIQAPCLVINGADDIVNTPRAAATLREGINNCRMVVLEGVGHLPHIEAGDAFRSAIDEFLTAYGTD